MKALKGYLFAVILACTTGAAYAQSGYEELATPQATANPDKVEVLEFFWYGCPHCFQFEPHIKAWKATKPDNVEFINAAPPLNPAWKLHSQAFYAAQVLGVLEEFHEPMFNAIHIDKKPMRKPKHIMRLVDSLKLADVDGEKFGKTMKSFNVDSKIRQAIQLARSSGVSAVPVVIINGKYRTSGSVAGSYPKLIKVLNELISRESAE